MLEVCAAGLGPPSLCVKFLTGSSSLSVGIYLFIFLSRLLFFLDAGEFCAGCSTVEVHMRLLLLTSN